MSRPPSAISIVTLMTPMPSDEQRRRPSKLPEEHLASIRLLEPAYLAENDPIKQSGFSGGAERWRAERSPLLGGVDGDGDFLDLGCANGFLLESVVKWASERGTTLVPFGLDLNPRLVQEATRRFDDISHHFWVGNAWGWLPPRRFRWVYAIWDLVPIALLHDFARHLLTHVVSQDGALIFGAYGSKSDDTPSADVAQVLRNADIPVSGEACGGELPSGGPVTRFAWIRVDDWYRQSNAFS